MHNKDAHQAASIALGQNSGVKIISVTAGKGGVGKTNISANLAIALAREGKRVLLFDADLSLANVDVLLGLHPQKNLSHVIAGEATLEDVMIEGPCGVKIIPASSGIAHLSDLDDVSYGGVIHAFEALANQVDILIVDTAAGISKSVMNFVQATQERYVVLCDEPTSLTDAYALIKVMSTQHGIHEFNVLVNMVENFQSAQALYKKLSRVCDKFLNVHLNFSGMIPYDKYVKKAVQRQKPFVTLYPSAQSSQHINKVAQEIVRAPVSAHINGAISFFIERMVNSTQVS